MKENTLQPGEGSRRQRLLRSGRTMLFVAACCVTVIALFFAEENWRGKRAWDRFVRETESAGLKVEVAKIAPPAVPDDQNFAKTRIVGLMYRHIIDDTGRRIDNPGTGDEQLDLPITLPGAGESEPEIGNWHAAKLTDLQQWQAYYRQLAGVTNVFPVPPAPRSAAADVLMALSRYDSVLNELREAGRRPLSRFPLEYDAVNPAAILLPHLAKLRGCSQWLSLRAIAATQDGRTAEALEDIHLLLRLVDSIHNEPILVSQLVRIRMADMAVQAVWEGVVTRKWSEQELVQLERELSQLDFLADHRLAMQGEIAFAASFGTYLRRHRSEIVGALDWGVNSDLKVGGDFIWLAQFAPAGWFYQNQLRCCRYLKDDCLPLVDSSQRRVFVSRLRKIGVKVAAQTNSIFDLQLRLWAESIPAIPQKFTVGQCNVDLARTACALERHRLTRGTYPEKLSELESSTGRLPTDLIDGRPLRFRKTSDRTFILYSIGWNEVDDGGKASVEKRSPQNVRVGDILGTDGDWVWSWPNAVESGSAEAERN